MPGGHILRLLATLTQQKIIASRITFQSDGVHLQFYWLDISLFMFLTQMLYGFQTLLWLEEFSLQLCCHY